MTKKELIGKLTTSHFENGEKFDNELFEWLIKVLQRMEFVNKTWLYFGMLFFVVLGIGTLYYYAWDGAELVVIIFSTLEAIVMTVIFICVRKEINLTKMRNKAYKSLGITEEEVKIAIGILKQECVYTKNKVDNDLKN